MRDVLIENNYPNRFVDTHIEKRIHTLIERSRNPSLSDLASLDRNQPRFCFPYIKGMSQSVARALRPFKVSCSFKNVNDLSRLFNPLKDITPLERRSNVVYRIPCKGCNSSYIGQTSRWLKTRINEHDNNVKRKEKEHTALTTHKIDRDHNFNYSEIKVLDKERNKTKRIIKEMCHIVSDKTSINLRTDVNNLSATYYGLI